MKQEFQFQHNHRKFTCAQGGLGSAPSDMWWWFSVSSDDRHRYAPFRVAAGDTQNSVQERVVAYYENLLLIRSMPPQPQIRTGGRPTKAAVAAREAAAEVRSEGLAD
ncbi:MAG: hypothetical protein U0163_20855 [Gemmatimonadaceae bacterium]